VYSNISSEIYVKDARKMPMHLYQNQLPILTKFSIANLNCNCKNYEFNKFTRVGSSKWSGKENKTIKNIQLLQLVQQHKTFNYSLNATIFVIYHSTLLIATISISIVSFILWSKLDVAHQFIMVQEY
jgi:hypothetical protein